jgi:hypothetical protein
MLMPQQAQISNPILILSVAKDSLKRKKQEKKKYSPPEKSNRLRVQAGFTCYRWREIAVIMLKTFVGSKSHVNRSHAALRFGYKRSRCLIIFHCTLGKGEGGGVEVMWHTLKLSQKLTHRKRCISLI